MPKDPEQVLTSIDGREMLDKNGIISTNHTLATPACYNKSINGDMIMNDVCLSSGDHDIKATSSTMPSSVLLSANNLNLVDHINSHDHGSNILLCHEYDDNDDDDAEEEEGRSTLIHPDSSVKGIQEQDDQYPKVKMKDNMINSGNGRGFGGDGDVDEAKIRAELELEIERDLEREIKAKIMMLSQRLDDLNTSRRSRSLLSCSTTTALKPNIATITASKHNNAHKNGNPRANHTAASTANDKRFDWTRTLRSSSSSDNKLFSMSSSYNQYSNNNIFINNVRSCSTPKLRAKYRSPPKSLEEAVIGYNKIANHNSADKIVSNNTKCGSSSHVEAMIKQCHEDEFDDLDQRCGSSNHVVAMVKQCHEDNEDSNHKINTSNVANSSKLLIKGNANHHHHNHNHKAMPPRPPLPKDPPKQRIPCRKVVTTPKPGLLWR